MRRRALLGASSLLVIAAAASGPAPLRSLFPSEADVFAEATGLARIDLPSEIVTACRPDLSDLRLVDAAGSEIPYVMETPQTVATSERASVRVEQVRREEVPRRDAAPIRKETYELSGPPRASRGEGWALVVEPAPVTFVARAHVTIDRGGGAPPETVDETVFRLASPRAVAKLGIPLGPAPASRLTVTFEHEDPFWLQPAFHLESSRSFGSGGRLAIPLEVLSSRAEGRTTVVELARPRGIVPAALRVASATPAFDRALTVYDEGPGRDPEPLGQGSIFRLAPGNGVEDLVVPLRTARGDRLRVVVHDGDSPPLADAAFTAVLGRPAIVAPLTAAAGGRKAATLLFGGGRARRPHYDLEALRPAPGGEVTGRRADAAARLYDPAALRPARLGPIRTNPDFDPAPPLAFAMRPGATIDLRVFAKRRTLRLHPSPEGLARVRLAPGDLAVLRGDLADLRVADADSRQWPYLLDRDAADVVIPLTIAGTTSRSHATTYRLEPSTGPVALDRVVLDPGAPFVDRAFRLTGEGKDGATTTLAQGRLVRNADSYGPVAVDVARTRVRRLELVVEDGDDAPLTFRSIEGRVPVPDLYLAAPAGTYALYLGEPDARAPRYELDRAREVVLAVRAENNRPGPLEDNPDFSAGARLTRGAGRQRTLLWGALIAAVAALAGLTLYLARRP